MISKLELEKIKQIDNLCSELHDAIFNDIEDTRVGNEMCHMITSLRFKLIYYMRNKEN